MSGPAFAIDRFPVKSKKVQDKLAFFSAYILQYTSEPITIKFMEEILQGRNNSGVKEDLSLPGPVCFSLKFSSANFAP